MTERLYRYTGDRYGRPVCFVFNNDYSTEHELNNVKRIDRKELEKIVSGSVNYKLLTEGLAYPAFYKGLDRDLIGKFADATKETRSKETGLWKKDKTTAGFQVNNLDDVMKKGRHVIMPKLFRRIVESSPKKRFDRQKFDKICQEDANRVKLIKNESGEITFQKPKSGETLYCLIKPKNSNENFIKLLHNPEDILFDPKY